MHFGFRVWIFTFLLYSHVCIELYICYVPFLPHPKVVILYNTSTYFVCVSQFRNHPLNNTAFSRAIYTIGITMTAMTILRNGVFGRAYNTGVLQRNINENLVFQTKNSNGGKNMIHEHDI